MPDFLQWSAALLALLGLFLWFWSARIAVHQTAAIAQAEARRKRQLGRVAMLAAALSALAQAAGASASPKQIAEVWMEASAAPSAGVSADLLA